MHRRTLLASGAAWPLAATAPWAHAARARAGATLVLGHQFPPGSLPDRLAQHFAELLTQRSAGALSVRVYGAAALGDEREHLSQLKKGTLDLTIAGDVVVGSLGNAFLVVNLPFLYRSVEHALQTYASPIGVSLRTALERLGLRPLSWHYVGTRVLTARRPVATLADLRSLKLRLPPDVSWTALWRRLGANVIQVPFPQLADALRLQQVTAQDNPPNFVRTAELYPYQTHLMPTDHMPQRQFVFCSAARWARLSAPQREWLQSCAEEASAWATQQAQADHERDLQWLVGPGRLQLTPLSLDGLSPLLREVAQTLGGPEGLRVFHQIQSL